MAVVKERYQQPHNRQNCLSESIQSLQKTAGKTISLRMQESSPRNEREIAMPHSDELKAASTRQIPNKNQSASKSMAQMLTNDASSNSYAKKSAHLSYKAHAPVKPSISKSKKNTKHSLSTQQALNTSISQNSLASASMPKAQVQ